MAATPTPIGVDAITSISRRILREEATDVYYLGSPFTWRLFRQNRVTRRGGFQIETRFIYEPWSTGGAFYGPEVLSVEPSDTEISGAWSWKEYYTNVTLDQRSLIRADHPDAVARYVVEQCEISKIDLKDKIAYGIWSDGSNFKAIDGMFEIVDNGTISPSYAGLSRTSYPFLKAQVDTTTTTLSVTALDSLWDLCTKGARAPTVTVSTRANLTRFESLLQPQVQYPPADRCGGSDLRLGWVLRWLVPQPAVARGRAHLPDRDRRKLVHAERELLRALCQRKRGLRGW